MKAQIDLPESLGEVDREIEIAIYRSVQESLHNIAKHSQAKNFSLRVERQDGGLCLLVDDDGIGFSGKGNPRRQSFGLLGMRERIAALGGTVRVRSRSGRGTRLRIMLPVTQTASLRKHVSSVHSEPERRRAPACPQRQCRDWERSGSSSVLCGPAACRDRFEESRV